MAIKISGTTVIDDSRNFCNLGNINATNINADIGGEYLCMIACDAITSGCLVMSCDGCKARPQQDDADYLLEDIRSIPASTPTCEDENATSIPIIFNCNTCCFASLRFSTNNYCCRPHVVCMRTHCAASDGSYTSTELCCLCINQCCKVFFSSTPTGGGQYRIGPCLIHGNTKAWVQFYNVGVCCSERIDLWTYCFCYCTSNSQIYYLGKGDCRLPVCQNCCLVAYTPFRTPDKNYYANIMFYNDGTTACTVCSANFQMNVQSYDDNFNPAQIMCNSTQVCGLSLCCLFKSCCFHNNEYFCYGAPYNFCICGKCTRMSHDSFNSTNQYAGGINPFTMGTDNWMLIEATWGPTCIMGCRSMCRQTMIFGMKPCANGQWASSCSVIIPAITFGCTHECDKIPFFDDCLIYLCRGCPTSFNGGTSYAFDKGDCIKRFTWMWGNCNDMSTKHITITCYKMNGHNICFCKQQRMVCHFCCACTYQCDELCTGLTNMCGKCLVFGGFRHCCIPTCGACRMRYHSFVYSRKAATNSGPMSAMWATSYPICPQQGRYITSAAPEMVFGTPYNFAGAGATSGGQSQHPLNYHCLYCCVKCKSGGDCYQCASAVYCWCLKTPTCLPCATANVTSGNGCKIRSECATFTCIDTASNIYYAAVKTPNADDSNTFFEFRDTGIYPIRNNTMWVGGGTGLFGTASTNCDAICTSLITYGTGDLIVNNHCEWVGIAQNTVSAGQTVKIAIPGMIDRSGFAGTVFGSCACARYLCIAKCCAGTSGATANYTTMFGTSTAQSPAGFRWYCGCNGHGVNMHIYYDCFKGGLVNSIQLGGKD